MPIILTKVVDHLSRHKSEVYDVKDVKEPGLSTSPKSNGRPQETWNSLRFVSQEISYLPFFNKLSVNVLNVMV